MGETWVKPRNPERCPYDWGEKKTDFNKRGWIMRKPTGGGVSTRYKKVQRTEKWDKGRKEVSEQEATKMKYV